MTTKLILLFSLLFFANEINAGGKNTDSTDEESSEFYEDWEDFEVEMDIFEGSPTISLNYGLSKMKLDGFGASFADPSV
ncbi:MAG: hypothetical protein ACM339_04140, partial [Ignavibacteria bacterium]